MIKHSIGGSFLSLPTNFLLDLRPSSRLSNLSVLLITINHCHMQDQQPDSAGGVDEYAGYNLDESDSMLLPADGGYQG